MTPDPWLDRQSDVIAREAHAARRKLAPLHNQTEPPRFDDLSPDERELEIAVARRLLTTGVIPGIPI